MRARLRGRFDELGSGVAGQALFLVLLTCHALMPLGLTMAAKTH